ncbi:GNAT family N-acetyltransferase [Phreatobacter sp.]|uniref:GNAT family N-acetyltransferase n=1 Tax=Phreatobacter sp. TaxID=1966341 RepID=UPI003F6F0AC9
METGIGPTYAFTPLTRADLPLVRSWLQRPHVARWWGEIEHEMAEIETILADPHVEAFLMLLDGRPVGYFQHYDPNAEDDHPFRGEPTGTLGLDLSIGEVDLTGRGHGSAFLKSFAGEAFARGVPRLITDPHPDNAASIRAFEKAGFVRRDIRDVPGFGPAQYMTCDPPVPAMPQAPAS